MKTLLLILLISFKLSGQTLDIPRDKVLHFGGSYIIASVTSQLAYEKGMDTKKAFLIGFGTTLVLGVAKELRDAQHGDGDWADFSVDVMGAYAGSFPILRIEIPIN